MAPELSVKRRKEVEIDTGVTDPYTDTDRMSSLPDSILCHILSFLPTKTAVSASLVSRRWRHLWEHLQVYNFSDNPNCNCQNPKKFKRFAFFVNSVLSIRKSRDIRKFKLNCCTSDDYNFQGDSVYAWVRAAIGPHLEELTLALSNCHGQRFAFPPSSLLNCTNLVSLSLVGDIHINFQPSSIHFPSLKMLKLDSSVVEVAIDIAELGKYNVDSILVFLSGCPILQTLDTYFDPHFLTNVPVPPSAKRLKLTGVNFSWTCLEIDSDSFNANYYGKTTLGIIANLQSMEEAYLDFFSLRKSEFVDPLLNHLRDQNRDLHLLLRHSTSKEEPYSPLKTWEPKSTTVPKCLKSKLTCVHLEGYQGFEDELAFAEYILRNGLVLHTVHIFFDTSMDLTHKYCSLKRLTDIPRGSVACQLKFDSSVSP